MLFRICNGFENCHNVCEEMKLLTRLGWDKMITICISFPNISFKRLKKSVQFVPKGAVNYKSKLVQAMAWHREDTKPLPGSVVIHCRPIVHIWVSRIDWVDYFTVLGKYIHTEKNGTVWAREWCLHPHSWKWAIPTPQVGSGRGTGGPYFVKSPLNSGRGWWWWWWWWKGVGGVCGVRIG